MLCATLMACRNSKGSIWWQMIGFIKAEHHWQSKKVPVRPTQAISAILRSLLCSLMHHTSRCLQSSFLKNLLCQLDHGKTCFDWFAVDADLCFDKCHQCIYWCQGSCETWKRTLDLTCWCFLPWAGEMVRLSPHWHFFLGRVLIQPQIVSWLDLSYVSVAVSELLSHLKIVSGGAASFSLPLICLLIVTFSSCDLFPIKLVSNHLKVLGRGHCCCLFRHSSLDLTAV